MQEVELNDDERTKCEVWTRVMGYHRPVDQWNKGKQSEHAERLYFREEHAVGIKERDSWRQESPQNAPRN